MDFLDDYFNLSLTQVANTCREILQEAIQSEVYDKYSPKKYKNTYQLIKNVRVDVRNGFIYVYVNIGNTNYTSNKENEQYPASLWTPYWVQHGHSSSEGDRFYYDQTPSRDYMTVAKERIERELGFPVEIINNELV